MGIKGKEGESGFSNKDKCLVTSKVFLFYDDLIKYL